MSDYAIPLPEQVRDLERYANAIREDAATLRYWASEKDRVVSETEAKIRDLKAQIAAGGTKQESLFGGEA